METSALASYSKMVGKIGAISAVALLSVGSTSATLSSEHFVAKANTLEPKPFTKIATTPMVEESVVVQAPVVAPAAPVAPVASLDTLSVRKAVAKPVYRGTGDPGLEAIARCESGGSYTAQNRTSTASGKYQFLNSTWGGYGGYSRAADAPPEVQDAKARDTYARSGTRPWAASQGCWGR